MSLRRLPILLALLLLAGTLLAAAVSVQYERTQADQRGTVEVERAADVIRLSMTVAMESLDDTAGLFDASQTVSADEFTTFSRRVLGRSGLSGVGWAERVPLGRRARYERVTGHAILEPAPTGLRRSPDRAVAYPVTFSASDLSTGNILGLDEAAEPTRRRALEAAVGSGAPTVTSAVSLFGSGQRGILLFQPVYRGGGTPALPADRRRLLRGIAVGAYRLDALMRTAAAEVDPGLPLEVRDGGTLLSVAAPGAGDGTRATIAVGGRRWSVLVGRPGVSWGLPATFLAAGLALTLFALALALTLARRDRFARVAVERATADLGASEVRYRSLVSAMTDGVVLQAATGAIVACNPAAERILGLTAEQMMGRASIDPRWRAVRDDGTPFPGEEHPAMVTLRTGVSQREVTMGVHKPDGTLTWINVSTEAIDGAGDVSVVCCFTDVTARRDVAHEQAALRRIATLVAADAEPSRVFERIAEEAAALIGADMAATIRFDGERTLGTLVGVWARGGITPPERGLAVELTPDTASGMVALTGRAARAGDERTTPGHAAEAVPDALLYSAVSAPILVDGAVWGALSAATTRSQPLPPGSEDRLGRLAELAALAILSASARDQLAMLASTDHLTGLWNRRAFHERLSTEIERARRHDRPLSLVMLDVDHFKRVNDLHGHPAGDRVLIEVASRLFSNVRESEIVARVGGEEFAWILPETDAEGAFAAAERARRAIGADPVPGVGAITVSLGLGDLGDAESAAELVRIADVALYRAKSEGRDRVVRYTSEGVTQFPG